MASLPTGTVTFLFTDIEGSTTLLQLLGDRRYAEVLEEHRRLLRDAFAGGHGQEVDTQGDAVRLFVDRAVTITPGGYYSEGLHWLEAALSLDSGPSSPMRAEPLVAAGTLARLLGDTQRAVARLEESVAAYRVLRDEKGMANALLDLGITAYRQSDYDRAVALLDESTALSRALGDKTTLALSIYLLGILARVRGDYGKAETLCKETGGSRQNRPLVAP